MPEVAVVIRREKNRMRADRDSTSAEVSAVVNRFLARTTMRWRSVCFGRLDVLVLKRYLQKKRLVCERDLRREILPSKAVRIDWAPVLSHPNLFLRLLRNPRKAVQWWFV
jgi:hypothetical protein